MPCVCVCGCPFWLGRAGRPPGRVLVRRTFSCGRSGCSLCLPRPLRAGVALLVFVLAFFLFLSFCAPLLSLAFRVFLSWVPWALAPCGPLPPFFFLFSFPPPPAWFFFPACFVSLFGFFCSSFFPPSFVIFFCGALVCWLCGDGLVCPRMWGVLVCVVVGPVLRQGPVRACALSFGAPCLCLFLLCCWLSCCACPMAPCWRRSSSPCCLWLVACGVARPPPLGCFARVLFVFLFFLLLSGVCWLSPPPPAGCGALCCALSCVESCIAAVYGVFCVVRGVVWRACDG